MQKKAIKNYSPILFIVLLAGISFYYNYHEIAFKRPQSVHKWRQADCASIALNYYQNGMHPLKSETHNLTSDKGTSGKCKTSEIPILYYSVAALYSIFGYHEYIYRIFNTFLFFLGLFFLFRMLRYMLKDAFWAISLTLLFFTSPVLVYYGNNFLSNSASLSFSIIGWYYFMRFTFESKKKWLYISMFVFLIAAAFKVTALFSLIALIGIYLMEVINIQQFGKKGKLFRHHLCFLLPVVFIFSIIGFWLLYAHIFNKTHDSTYFSTTIFPIWDLDNQQINHVINNVKNIWVDQYFHKSVLLFITICFIFILAFFKKNIKLLIFSILFILAEVIVYIILQFMTFADHDYYTIDIYILPILIVLAAFYLLKTSFNKIFSSPLAKVFFSVFLLFNVYQTNIKITGRYHGWMNDYEQNKDIYSITPYLRQIGISPNDTVISIPDNSNASLYLMNQKGWTEYTDARFNKETAIHYNSDSLSIKQSINKGAKYMIINGIDELYNKPYLLTYCKNNIGKYNNVLIFDLKSSISNFNLPERVVHKTYICGAELLSDTGKYFISKVDGALFEYDSNQNNEFAHSGKYSVKLNAASPYGMTIRLNNLKKAESFKISVWRKINAKAKGGIVASSSPSPYYNNNFKVIKTDSNGWEKLLMEFFIPYELENQELVIYLHNPEKEPVYFDDFKIVSYKTVIGN